MVWLRSELVQRSLFVFLLPLLILVSFIAVNHQFFTQPHNKMGDEAVNGLSIIRASHFQEYLGPYSRFGFHHPGPISFYYYAFMERAFFFIGSEHGRHLLAQVLLNCIFLGMALHLTCVSFESKFSAVLLGVVTAATLSNALGGGFYVSLWGPAIIVLPLLVFVLAAARLALGCIRDALFLAFSTPFIVQNQVGSVVIVGPLLLLAIGLGLGNRRRQREGGLPHHGGEGTVPRGTLLGVVSPPGGKGGSPQSHELICVLVGLVFFLAAFFPPIYEQFSAPEGNLTKIVSFFLQHGAANHTWTEAIRCVAAVFRDSVPPAAGGNPFFVIVPLLILSGLGFAARGKRDSPRFLLLLFTGSGLLLSVFGGTRTAWELHKYLFWMDYAFVALLFFMAIHAITSHSRIPPPGRAVVAGLVVVLGLYSFARNARVPAPVYDDTVDQLIAAIKPARQKTYELTWGAKGPHHMQWPVAAGLAYKLIRHGYRVGVPDDWLFMFGEQLACEGRDSIEPIWVFSADKYQEGEQAHPVCQHTFTYGGTTIEFGLMKPVSLPLNIGYASSDVYFRNFFPAQNDLRWVRGDSGTITFVLDESDLKRAQYELSLVLGSARALELVVSINGLQLGRAALHGLAAEKCRQILDAGMLKAGLNAVTLALAPATSHEQQVTSEEETASLAFRELTLQPAR
jgi:hypothetical protein